MDIVAIIVILIKSTQVYFFVRNLLRMIEFRDIFQKESTWCLLRNHETGFVSGIGGNGNKIFGAIRDSINKYLGNNEGSVIDFGLIKDAVDRHCDSVENDISTQTPIPLYCGLAGTMAGVIIGLWDLLSSNSISALMGSTVGGIEAASSGAAAGINSLLNGVAWAMLASICGILLTTINSLLFKNYKLKEESGKNGFLAWMQSKLLPELPSDTSEALNNLVKNLNKFNNIFANNTSNLGAALQQVNESYAIQAEIIKAVHDMDVMKMAKANIKVLEELKECTDKLEQFNQYLDDIHGYTDAIHHFEEQFQQEANRIHVLEEIKQFFERHKGSMSKVTADVDAELKKAFKDLGEHSADGAEELKNRLAEQSSTFKDMISQEKEAFEEFAKQMKTQFSTQLSQMPAIARHLEQISDIPDKLSKLIDKVEKSNSKMVSEIRQTMNETAEAIASGEPIIGNSGSILPKWMQWTILSCLALITIMCSYNFVSGLISNESSTEVTSLDTSVYASDSVIGSTAYVINDTTAVNVEEKPENDSLLRKSDIQNNNTNDGK